MKAINIKWDTDGEEICLPTEMEIPNEIEDDEEAIIDYLSDETGFCMFGFDIEEKEFIGASNIAALILAGYVEDNGLELKQLSFGSDGSYQAYIVDAEAKIENHYTKVAEFDSWLKIYDDEELIKSFDAKHINVYRAAEMGCIIQLID